MIFSIIPLISNILLKKTTNRGELFYENFFWMGSFIWKANDKGTKRGILRKRVFPKSSR
jgi:hypothetical protein